MDFIVVPLTTGIVFAAIYGLFELFVRRKERLAIIEKIGDKLDASACEGKLGLPSYKGNHISFSSLKAGCLLTGIGLGLLVGFLISTVLAVGGGADLDKVIAEIITNIAVIRSVSLDKLLVVLCHKKGLKVLALALGTDDVEESDRKAIELGVDVLATDRPELFVKKYRPEHTWTK